MANIGVSLSPAVAVVGAGAVGGYFGGMLARAGEKVTMIGRPGFVDAVNRRGGLQIDSIQFNEVVDVAASTDMSAARDAELVLFTVKTFDTEAAGRELKKHLREDALVLSLQNGVDNVDKLTALGIRAIPSVVYIAASTPEPGVVKHVGRGDLVIGSNNDTTRRISHLFEQAGTLCKVVDNVAGEQWVKFLCNCALNAVSALGRSSYGEIPSNPEANRLVKLAVDEILAVAQEFGIEMPGLANQEAAYDAVFGLCRQIAAAKSSTAQDLERGRRTEIDSLNGLIVAYGRQLSIPTPINQTLYALVKLAEARGQQG